MPHFPKKMHPPNRVEKGKVSDHVVAFQQLVVMVIGGWILHVSVGALY